LIVTIIIGKDFLLAHGSSLGFGKGDKVKGIGYQGAGDLLGVELHSMIDIGIS
jgi:hypothetical protein